MNNKLPLVISSLLLLSSVAFAAESNSKKGSEQSSCCMVANGCVEHSNKNLKAIDSTVSAVDAARNSNDPKAMHAALELAYKSLSTIRTDEEKSGRAMKALYNHLTKVEERAAKLKQEQSDLNAMLQGSGLDASFINF